MKFKIYYSSGVGGDRIDMKDEPDETLDFKNKEKAMDYAYDMACDEFGQYAGLHGIPEEDDEEEYADDRENSIEYDAIPVVDEKIKKASDDMKK